jgi:hypothetical protein
MVILAAVLASIEPSDSLQHSDYLFIPLAGPFVTAGAGFGDGDPGLNALLIGDGILQNAALALFIVGVGCPFVTVEARDPPGAGVTLRPGGLSLGGRF